MALGILFSTGELVYVQYDSITPDETGEELPHYIAGLRIDLLLSSIPPVWGPPYADYEHRRISPLEKKVPRAIKL